MRSKTEKLNLLGKSHLFKYRYLLFMAIPGFIWMVIFNYIPMYGVVIAFQNYRISQTVFEAPWVGLEHFRELFAEGDLGLVLKNTLGISFLKLLFGFPLPIILRFCSTNSRASDSKRPCKPFPTCRTFSPGLCSGV